MKYIQSRASRYLAVSLSVVLALSILSGCGESLNRSKPADVLKAYFSYINTKEYEKMYDLLSDKSKSSITQENFISRNQKIYEGIEAEKLEIQVGEIQESEKNRIIEYTTKMDTIAGDLEFSNETTLIRGEKRSYGIDWSSETIFPVLSDDEKVTVTTLKGKRGSVLDRNGSVIAGDGTVASVGLVPGKIGENRAQDLETLAQCLDVSVETIENKLSASWVKEDSFVPVKSIGQEDTALKERLLQIPGVMITDQEARVYPLGGSAGHLTGYVQGISAEELEKLKDQGYSSTSVIGKIGLEKLWEDRLRGVDGCSVDIVNQSGKKQRTLVSRPQRDGENIRLTIDAALQTKLYGLTQQDKSSSVVMNPKTGEILALVSTPAYDPNEFVRGMSNDRWTELNENPDKPLYNRFKAALTPGSSFKPVTGTIGLSTQSFTADMDFGHSGLSWQKDSSWGNYQVTTLKEYSGAADLKNALIYSDNIYFAKAALKIGEYTLAQQLTKIGFEEELPFAFGLSSSQFGTEHKFDSEIQLADSGYGQGKILVNPVHMASIYSAFVNDGNMLLPYLEYQEQATPQIWKTSAFSPTAVSEVRNDLVQVIESPNGTGHSGMVPGLQLAGKTGTAEIKASKEDTTGTELGWFNAFTVDPDSAKQCLVLTMVEDVKDRGGSHYVIPIVKSVFEDYMK